MSQPKMKSWEVIDVVNVAKANSPISGESRFVTISLRPVKKKKTLTAETPKSKTFFENQQPDLMDDIAEGYDFENGKVTGRDKLKEIKAEGYQTTIKVDPFYVKDRKGNYITYPKGHPDEDKPRIKNTRTILVLEGETEDEIRDMINDLNARNGSKVVIEESNLKDYSNSLAKEILEEHNKGDEAGDGEQV